MCSDLRFIGPEESPPDFLTLRPNLSATVIPTGVLIPWKFDGYSKWIDVLRLEVDRSDGKGFVHQAARVSGTGVSRCRRGSVSGRIGLE